MWSGKLARRVIPALAFCAGTAAAGDPVLPSTATDSAIPGVIVSKPLFLTSDPPPVPPLTPLPIAPGLPGGPIEKAPAPRPRFEPTGPVTNLPPLTLAPEGGAFIATDFAPPAPLHWARAEYIFWYLTNGHVQPLATTSPPGEPIAIPGFPGRTALFGNDDPLDDPRSGARLTIGTWLDQSRTIGVEASAFWLAQQRNNFLGGSLDGSAVLASSPFVDATTNLPTAVLISSPGLTSGWTDITFTGRSIVGAEALLRPLLCAGPGWRLDGLIGYRYRKVNEALDIQETLIPIAPFFVPGTTVVTNEVIRADNSFNGGVVGFEWQKECGDCWVLNVRPTVGVGPMFTTVRRNGITQIHVPGTDDLTLPGATYNLSSNIGQVSSNDWTVIPELDVRVTKTLWDCVRLSVGYSAMFFPSLARVGEQIDPFLNPNLFPPPIPGGPMRPAPILEHSSAWLHGFNLGLELRF
jgi:hypothetical protein